MQTCEAMCDVMKVLGIAIDGGKDSLSMAAKVKLSSKQSEVVKAPGSLVISTYAPVPDITLKVTPELKGSGKIVWLDLSGRAGNVRAGASALAQVFGQVGDEVPDLEQPDLLRKAFELVQTLIKEKHCTAGHDVSDGGLITTLLEMAFASNCGLRASVRAAKDEKPVQFLFAEECGLVLEVKDASLALAEVRLKQAGLTYQVLGEGLFDADLVEISLNGQLLVQVITDAATSTSIAE